MDSLSSISPFLTTHGPNLVGVLLPPVIDILNKDIPEESSGRRFMISLMVCFLAAAVIKFPDLSTGSPESVLTSFGIIFTESQAVYRLYFKDSYLRGKLQDTLESKEVILDPQTAVG